MPITWHQDGRQRWIVLVYSDPYELAQLERATETIITDPVFRDTKLMLVDARHSSPPTPDFVKGMISLAERYASDLSGMQVAICVSQEATFGMARMAELLVESKQLPIRLHAVRGLDAAEEWLQRIER